MTISEKLLALNSAKIDIKNAISAKGVDMADVAFVDYDVKIGEISVGGGQTVGWQGYSRPTDWLDMPDIQAGDQKIAVLVAIYEGAWNAFAFNIAGNYNIDWGDGSSEDINSGVTIEHEYDFSNVNLEDTLSTLGYKQALIIITPQSGQTLTTFKTPQPTGGSINRENNFLHIRMAGSGISILGNYYHGSGNYDGLMSSTLKEFEFIGANSVSNFRYFLAYTRGLAKLSMDMSNATDIRDMCDPSGDIRYLPALNFGSAGSMSESFYKAIQLEIVDDIIINSVTDMYRAFRECRNLRRVGVINVNSVTNFAEVFLGCEALNWCDMYNIGANISFSGCDLSKDAIVNIFNNLKSVTATITITNNPGVSDLTSDDRSIALNKGWTIVES